MTSVFNQLIALPILNFVFYGQIKVEGRPKEVVDVPSWFNNVEGFILQNTESFLSTEPSYMTKTKHVETDDVMNSVIERKFNKKKKKKKSKKAAKITQNEKDTRSNEQKVTKKKKKRKSKENKLKFIRSDNRLKFIKSDNKDIENKDSNLSSSQEKRAQRKPVDIIVHIKMDE